MAVDGDLAWIVDIDVGIDVGEGLREKWRVSSHCVCLSVYDLFVAVAVAVAVDDG